jgi:hypothetical protein
MKIVKSINLIYALNMKYSLNEFHFLLKIKFFTVLIFKSKSKVLIITFF